MIRAVFVFAFCVFASAALAQPDPLFDFDAIVNDPLDVQVESEEVKDGLIIRKLTFAYDAAPDSERVFAIFLLPEKGDTLPGLLWCQGGMAPASTGIPGIYARKGYACINITIPHDRTYTWGAWDAQNPAAANLSRYAVMQMRAITVLCSDPRVDAERIGVGGASYGGFFSTLVAGADPRVKAGVSFFTGGHHDMGSNLPQFTKMPDRAAAETWMRTIDPAWRHTQRDVPFMWTLPTNDNWFYFPAVVETYKQAITKDKVLAVVPYWTHGFPPNVDQQIFDWFDIHLTKTRAAYNKPGPLHVDSTPEGLRATWTTDRPMKKAELVISPNAPAIHQSPWLGQWVYRLHQPFDAAISADGLSASAMVRVIDPSRPMWVYGNVTDENDVITSTLPILLDGPYPVQSARGEGEWNGCPWGELDPPEVAQLIGMAQRPGVADDKVAHRGAGSVRVDPGANDNRRTRILPMKLFHVPYLAHRLTVAVRSEAAMALIITVEALPPANWQTPAVKALMGTQPEAIVKPTPAATTTVNAHADWQEITLDIPAPAAAIGGYQLRIAPEGDASGAWWYDSVTFTPVASNQ